MAALGSSPLNLTLDSQQYAFNAIRPYSVISGSSSASIKSIFDNTEFSPYPTGISDSAEAKVSSIRDIDNLHDDSDYSISPSEVISYTSDEKLSAMRLSNADFAYLKHVGVYPNNRLMIARRFASPVHDDLTSLRGAIPISTLISWTPDGNDFFENITFGEAWEEADASFRDVLNEVGKDVIVSSDNKGGKLGDFLASGMGAVPLPGFMEGLQYMVFKKMGLSDVDASSLPLGNPNLVREAMRRKTLDKERAGSGLKADITIKMSVEYEMKFINGIDPTLIYYDVIANALAFGTSDSQFQFSKGLSGKVGDFINNLMSGTVDGVKNAIKMFVETIVDGIKSVAVTLIEGLINPPKNDTTASGIPILGSLLSTSAKVVAGVVSKYKVKILGITNALTGSPSTPWHITIGNPKRPMFSSGDMLMDNVKLTFGPTLGFNDLPQSVKLEFTLKNARSLGSQEIYGKFNTGKGRSYKRSQLTYVESDNFNISDSEAAAIDNNIASNTNSDTNQAISSSAGYREVTSTNGTTQITDPSNSSPEELEKRRSILSGKIALGSASTSEQQELKSIQSEIEAKKTKTA